MNKMSNKELETFYDLNSKLFVVKQSFDLFFEHYQKLLQFNY